MMPSYAALQMETDSDRVHRSYMATEANFRTLKEVELNNLLVPIVGDFAGPKAIRSVSDYLKEHKAIGHGVLSVERRAVPVSGSATTGGSSTRTPACCRSTRRARSFDRCSTA